jgi:hypothetical protein
MRRLSRQVQIRVAVGLLDEVRGVAGAEARVLDPLGEGNAAVPGPDEQPATAPVSRTAKPVNHNQWVDDHGRSPDARTRPVPGPVTNVSRFQIQLEGTSTCRVVFTSGRLIGLF